MPIASLLIGANIALSLLIRWMSYNILTLTIGGWCLLWVIGMWWLRYDAPHARRDRYRMYGTTLIIGVGAVVWGNALLGGAYLDAGVRLFMVGSASRATGIFGWPLYRGKVSLDWETTAMWWIAIIILVMTWHPQTTQLPAWSLVGMRCSAWVVLLFFYQGQWKDRKQIKDRLLFIVLSVIAGLSVVWWGGRVLLHHREAMQAARLPQKQHIYHVLPASTPTPYVPIPDMLLQAGN